MKTRSIVLLALLVLGTTLATAQTHDTMQHMMAPASLIDGSKTPEQIPDSVAFQLWLHHHYSEPSLVLPRIPKADLVALKAALANYGKEFPGILSAYGATAGSSNAFDSNHYALVNSLWSQMKLGMSPAGFDKFSRYLQHERAGMRVSNVDFGLGTVAERNRKELNMVASAVPTPTSGMTTNYSSYFTLAPVGTTTGADGFAKDANGALGSQWTTMSGTFAVSSGALKATSGGSGGVGWAYYKGIFSSDQCASGSLGAVPPLGGVIGISVRVAPSAETFYYAYWTKFSGWSGIYLYKIVNGTPTQLGYYGYTIASGDGLKVCAIGTNITAFINAKKVISATDSSIAPGSPGILGTVGGGSLTEWSGTSSAGMQISGQVSGTTICQTGCNGALHTPHVTNQLTTANGTVYGNEVFGAQVAAPNYLDASNNQIYDYDLIGNNGTGVAYDGVDCSQAGSDFFEANGLGTDYTIDWEQAASLHANTTPFGVDTPIMGTTWWGFKLSPQCVYTPDWNPEFMSDPDDPHPPQFLWAPYYHTESWCHRPHGSVAGTHWACAGDAEDFELDPYPWAGVWYGEFVYLVGLYGNFIDAFCTNFDNGYNTWDSPPGLYPVTPRTPH